MRILHFGFLLLFFGMYLLVKIPGGILLTKGILPDLYGMGDLYRFSYLGNYRDSTLRCQPPEQKPETDISLFVLGDSFTGPFSKEFFPGSSHYSFVNWNQFPSCRIKIKPGKRRKNLMIIECSEKHILLRFSEPEVRRFLAGIASSGEEGFQVAEKGSGFAFLLEKYAGRPQVTDQNLHMLLFSNEAVLLLKEAKANFNKHVFSKIAPEVEEYPAKNMLLQRMTTDTSYLYMSSFRRLSKKREDETVLGMKLLVNHFRNAGIDSVAFALIPNPVSVIAPSYRGRRYNNLIPLLEKRMKETGAGCISVFSEFSEKQEKVYRRGDTHWNASGEKIWLGKAGDWLNQ